MSQVLVDALVRNQGQVLTPELIAGLVHVLTHPPSTPIQVAHVLPGGYHGYTFAAEPYDAILHELEPLTRAFNLEMYGEDRRENVDAYLAEYHAGMRMVFTLRTGGELVGYMPVKVYRSTATGDLVAQDDGLYIQSEHRGGLLAMRFSRYIDEVATSLGVSELRTTAPYGTKTVSLSVRMGFTPESVYLTKRIEAHHGQES